MVLLLEPNQRAETAVWLWALLVLAALGTALHFQGDDLVPYGASLAMVVASLVMAACSSSGPATPSFGWVGLALAVFVLWAVLSLTWTEIPYLTMLHLGMLLGALAMYASGRLLGVRPTGQRLLVPVLTGLGLVIAALIVLEAAAGQAPTATFLNPNTAAAFVNLCWPIPAVLFLRSDGRPARLTLLALVGLMVFAATVNGSRAAAMAALATVLLIALVGRNCSSGRGRIIGLLTLVPASMLVANLAAGTGFLGSRGGVWARAVEMTGNPTLAGSSRWTIWQGAWDMIMASPLLGHGPGTFFQIYPAYRLPADRSAGFHAHNDYLQIWLELGLPGILLVLAIGVVAACHVWRACSARHSAGAPPPAAVIAAAALGGLAVHSLVSYNLQVMVFALACGLGLAFIEEAQPEHTRLQVRMASAKVRGFARLAVLGLAGLALVQLASMTLAHRATQAGEAASIDRDYDRAVAQFGRAYRLWNAAEPAWTGQARTYLRAINTLPTEERDLRAAAKRSGLSVATQAERRNPHRSEVHTITAKLHLAEPGSDPDAAARAFRKAIDRNPRAIEPRVGLARLAREWRGPGAARQVIEDGLHAYGDQPPPVLLQIRSALATGGV